MIDMKNILRASLALMLGVSICCDAKCMQLRGAGQKISSSQTKQIDVKVKGTIDATVSGDFIGQQFDLVLIKDGKSVPAEESKSFKVNHAVKFKIESNILESNEFILKHDTAADVFRYKVNLIAVSSNGGKVKETGYTTQNDTELNIDSDFNDIEKMTIKAELVDDSKIPTAATGDYKGDLKITISAN